MPNKYTMVSATTNIGQAIDQINKNFGKLDAEVTTKQFKDKNGNTMLIGNLQNGQFGMSLLDKDGNGQFIGLYRPNRFGIVGYQNGVPVSLDGMAPDDGRQGKWVAKPGQDVLALLGG